MSKRRFIVRNRRKRKILFSILFIMLFMITIGYSTLSTKLNIGGSLGVSKVKCQTKNKLYNVLKCAVEDGLALEYTGAHQDSMDASKSTEKIYHWYAPSGTAGNSLANQILEKNNVIFANHCWQMIRTTDTGGVKMIYNGEAENNQCLNTRGTHVGYGEGTNQNLASNYWYGTDYTYDSTAKTFKVSGTTEQTTWNATAGPTLIGKYTCKGTTVDATCATLYLVESYYNTSGAYVIPLNSNSNYSQFGTLQFNASYNSATYVGYMYGDVYPYSTLASTSSQSYPTSSYTILSSTSFADTYQYSKTISYTGSSYSLVDPILGSVIPEDSYDGYYTYRSATTTSGAQPYYIVGRNGTGTNYYYVRLSGTKQLSDFNMMIGDSLTDNGDGTYTVNNASSVTPVDWYSNYASYKEQYTCGDATTTTCASPRYLSNTTRTNYTYVNAGEKVTISITRNGLELTDTMTVRKDEWYKNYSTYSDYKYTCGDTSTTCIESTLRMIDSYNATGYTYAPNHYYGSSVTWDGTNYTLQDVDGIEDAIDLNSLSTHHYMCVSNGLKTCSTVAYIYYTYPGTFYYITLSNGVQSVEKAMEDMFTKNTTNSTMKSGVDAWYKHYLLEDYDDYIEDTIYCNDRSIRALNGWNPDGGMIDAYLQFKEYNATSDLSCTNTTDQFSISNNNAKLTYKVGLMSSPEMNILNNSNARKTGQYYWLASPRYFYDYVANGRYMSAVGNMDGINVYNARGVRPAVSLSPGVEFGDGDGSMANPYYVGDTYSITNSSSMFHVKEKSPPGWEVKLESDDYIATSFKLNGTLVEGDSFIMPEEDAIITDIQYFVTKYSITNSDSSVTVPNIGRYNSTITLEAEGYKVTSFKMNGTLIEGNSFVMPAEDVVITEITKIPKITIESEHNPYANSINNVTYYENTFEEATSLTVELTYQTESTSYDWVYLYDTNGSTTPFNNKKYGGKTLKTETLTINSNYLKIVFKTDNSGNNYYGFKAVITPNY